MNDKELEKLANKYGWGYVSYVFDLTDEQIIIYRKHINPIGLLNNCFIDKSVKNNIEIGIFYE